MPQATHHHVRRRPDSSNAVAWVWRSQCGDHPVMAVVSVAPCQCLTPGGVQMTSPLMTCF